MLGFSFPFFLAIAAITPIVIRNAPVLDSREVYFTPFRAVQSISLFLAFVVGAGFAARKQFKAKIQLYDGCLDFLFYLTFAAYVVWFGPMIASRPSLVIETLTGTMGAMYDVRLEAQNISGVTTATQFGISFAIIYALKKFQDRESLPRKYDIMMGAILMLALFRASVFSERIAVIEVGMALFVIFAASIKPAKAYASAGIKYFPFLLYAAAPLFFAIFEYPRSWLNRYIDVYDSFPHFVADRFTLYYVTSLNNICALMDYTSNPTFMGEWTLNWLYRFPFIGSLLAAKSDGDSHSWFLDFLSIYATREYNNTTGFLTVIYDWGWPLGVLLMGIYGAASGLAFASFRSGNGVLRYVYPVFLYSIFEIMRIGYIFDGRAIAAIIGIIIAIIFWRKAHLSNS